MKAAIEKQTGAPMQWVASNCSCGTAIDRGRQFRSARCEYAYFEMPYPGYLVEKQAWKTQLRHATRTVLGYFKAMRYASLSKSAEVVHFQQILNGYGSKVLFHWLSHPSKATRVVTVHELDEDQLGVPTRNETYNRADGIIVHCEDMKQRLVGLGVRADKIHVVLHGTALPAPWPDSRRDAEERRRRKEQPNGVPENLMTKMRP